MVGKAVSLSTSAIDGEKASELLLNVSGGLRPSYKEGAKNSVRRQNVGG